MVSQSTVEETWREVARLSPAKATREVHRLTQRQPDLFAFVATWTEDLSAEAAELTLYLLYAVFRMFEKGAAGKIRRIRPKDIIRKYEENDRLLERLQGADERFLERAAVVEASRQPHVIASVIEAILEAPEWESPLHVLEDEFGLVFLTIKTVIDALDDSAAPQ